VADATQGGLSWLGAGRYVVAQIAGAFLGVAVADLMFDEPMFAASRHVRAGWPPGRASAWCTTATALFRWLVPPLSENAGSLVVSQRPEPLV